MKISQALIDSQSKRKQTTGGLTAFDEDGNPYKYCALGALACEKGMIKKYGDSDDISYIDIIEAYGVDPCIIVSYPRKSFFEGKYHGREDKLVTLIWRLNDRYKWSFKKIGKFIKGLEDKGIITYEES